MKNIELEQQFQSIYGFVKNKLEKAPGCHDFDHTLRVLKNAEILAKQIPGARIEIIRLAALLHDIARPEEMSAKGQLCHAEQGAELCIALLKKHSLSDEDIKLISECIRCHRFRGNGPRPQSLEAKIIYDADKLDSIGAIGIGRAFHFAGRENARVHNSKEEAVNSEPYSRDDSAYREYLVKLQHVPDKMLTEPGRKLASSRAEFMHNFFIQLENETKTF